MKAKIIAPKNQFILNRLFLLLAVSAASLQAETVTLMEDASASAEYRLSNASIQTGDMVHYKDNGGNVIVNYIGDVTSTGYNDFQAALKFTLPATSSVLSTAKLHIKVIDKSNAPTAVVKLADNNSWQQTSGGTSSFPTLTNAVTLLSGYSIPSTGNLALSLDATSLTAKMGSIISLVVSSGNATSGSNTYFNFVADDDASGNKAYLALTFKPQVQSVMVPANNTYKVGDALNFIVSFDSLVNVTGTPKLSLTLNTGGTVQASYVSGSGSRNLVFRYTVASGDADADGVTVGALALNGGTIRSDNSDDAELALYSVGATTGVKVDGIVPSISNVAPPAGGTYISGQNLDFIATFNRAVNVASGTPYITLTIGGVTKHAVYTSGSGTTALVFRYTLASGDAGTLATGTGITLNGGTVNDGAGNDATLTFTAPTTSGITVDAVVPTISNVAPPSSGTYISGQNLDFTATFSKAVSVVTTGGTPYIPLTIGGVTKHAIYTAGSGTTALVFRYTLASGDAGALATGTGITLNGGTIKDGAGNNATLTFTAPTTTGITVDATAPSISSVNPPNSGSYRSGQNLDFAVGFSEPVNVDITNGTPYLSLTVGSKSVHAEYQSGSGTSSLVFRYAVADGDEDSNGITIGANLVANGGTIKDIVGNYAEMALNSVPSTTSIFVDAVAPAFVTASSSMASDNSYVDVVFSEPIHGLVGSGSNTLEASSFTLQHDQAQGNAGAITIQSATQTSTTSARIYLQFSGVPNGAETVVIAPASLAILDLVGNPMPVYTNSGAIHLYDKTPANIAPVADTQSVQTSQDQGVTIVLSANDADGSITSYTLGTAAHGTLSLSGDSVVYTPTTGYTGSDEFTFTATDNNGAVSNSATIKIEVLAPVKTLVHNEQSANGFGISFHVGQNTASIQMPTEGYPVLELLDVRGKAISTQPLGLLPAGVSQIMLTSNKALVNILVLKVNGIVRASAFGK